MLVTSWGYSFQFLNVPMFRNVTMKCLTEIGKSFFVFACTLSSCIPLYYYKNRHSKEGQTHAKYYCAEKIYWKWVFLYFSVTVGPFHHSFHLFTCFLESHTLLPLTAFCVLPLGSVSLRLCVGSEK